MRGCSMFFGVIWLAIGLTLLLNARRITRWLLSSDLDSLTGLGLGFLDGPSRIVNVVWLWFMIIFSIGYGIARLAGYKYHGH